jgi:hypothetical protein
MRCCVRIPDRLPAVAPQPLAYVRRTMWRDISGRNGTLNRNSASSAWIRCFGPVGG